jgi:hypothetical protein
MTEKAKKIRAFSWNLLSRAKNNPDILHHDGTNHHVGHLRWLPSPHVEILAEAAGFDFGGDIAICRGDNADVHGAGSVLAEFLELAFLKDAQELALKFERHCADLIEEKRATVGEFEKPDTVFDRAYQFGSGKTGKAFETRVHVNDEALPIGMTEVPGSHAIYVSKPEEIAEVIRQAADASIS